MRYRVGSVLSPTHAATFHAQADNRLASALHRAGANLPALGHVTRIIHAMHLASKVTHHLVPTRPRRRTTHRQTPQLLQDHRTALVLEPMAPVLPPRLRRF